MKFVLTRDEILDLEGSLKKEYLLTNGRGGYCSNTVLDCATRKYHGLLVLPLPGASERIYNFLSKLEAVIWIGEKAFRLSTNKFPGVFEPVGHKYVEKFEFVHHPVTYYMIGDVELTRSVLMPRGTNTVLVRYSVVKSPKKLLLKAMPLLAYRDIHQLSKENMNIRPRPFPEKNGFKIEPYPDLPPLYVQSSKKSEFYPSPMWMNNFEYTKERNRGFDYQEDLFSPGVFELNLKEGDSVVFRASLDPSKSKFEEEWDAAEAEETAEVKKFGAHTELIAELKFNARHYLINESETPSRTGIVAGYHWFGEWGRDTMISLAGITLCTGRESEAIGILSKFAKFQKDGLLPNFLTDSGNHPYNTIDTSFLFIRAAQQYLEYTSDRAGLEKKILPAMIGIVRAFLDGHVPVAGLGDKGLVYAGTPDTQLTWMDARVNGKPVTPRNGAAVEINALWYNALCFLLEVFAKKLDPELMQRMEQAAKKFRENFIPAFWNDRKKCLFDVYRNDLDRDASIRPNQLFAAGLPFTCLTDEHIKTILQTVKFHLVTPYGLRTLSPEDLMYQPDYRGGPEQRDAAYHQGMVWPWLIGIFADAIMKVTPKKDAGPYLRETFAGLLDLPKQRYCLGHIAELFKPNPPFTSKGCAAQAWSLAEVLRIFDGLEEKRGAQS
jgi:predicted glycogen debranching enzyme